MTIGYRDICRSAAVLICQHGEDAALETARRDDTFLNKGDFDGQRVWKMILVAVKGTTEP